PGGAAGQSAVRASAEADGDDASSTRDASLTERRAACRAATPRNRRIESATPAAATPDRLHTRRTAPTSREKTLRLTTHRRRCGGRRRAARGGRDRRAGETRGTSARWPDRTDVESLPRSGVRSGPRDPPH